MVQILQIRKTWLTRTPLYLSEAHTVIGLQIIQKPTRNTGLYLCAWDIKQHDTQVVLLSLTWDKYGDIAGVHPQSPDICMTIFSASVSNLSIRLPQSHVCRYYASWRALTPPTLWMQKHIDLRAQNFAHLPDLWHHITAGSLMLPAPEAKRRSGINPAIRLYTEKKWVFSGMYIADQILIVIHYT
jgi:hypothetical protein